MATDLELLTQDGVRLSARHHTPTREAVGAALIVPAMGVPQRFYERFTGWLTDEGFHVLTFDYRGMGGSRHRPLSQEPGDIVTWAQQDTAAALEALRARSGDLPLTWIGHSLGGQIVPLVPNHTKAQKIITIATGSGYWRHNPPPLKRKVWFFWYGAVPIATTLCGYFPGKSLRMVADLPRGVVWQWRKWCMDPDYAAGAEGPAMRARYASVTTPITSLSFTDDEMMSERSIAVLHSHYTGAARTMRRYSPEELGLPRIGHFGFFRAEMEAPLWRQVLAKELVRAS